MLKKLTTVFALVAAVAATSMATDTRTLTLGNNHEVLVDDANIYLFPSRVNQFPNIAVAEVGSYFYENEFNRSTGGSFSEIGRLAINWKFGNESPWILSTNFFTNIQDPLSGGGSNGSDVFDIISELNNPVGFNTVDNLPNKRLQLIYGRKLGNMNFGFSLGYTGSSLSDKIPSPEFKESMSRISVGVGLSDQAMSWDIAVHANLTSFKQEDDNVNFEADGATDFSVYGRLFHSVNPQWTVVPVIGIMSSSIGVDVPGSTTPLVQAENLKYSGFSLMGGCGIHYMPSNNVLAVIQPGIAFSSSKREWTYDIANTTADNSSEEKYNFTSIPYFKAGVEGDVFSWLDARFGATSYWLTDKFEENNDPGTPGDETEERSESYPSNQTYLGFGFNFGRLHVDTYTDPQLFLNGFNFISGRNTTMNFQISALMELF